jgi:hypothetical protein
MFDVCHTRLYHDNMFHLTGLPVDATSREIARRQDDLRAAEVAGDWQSEFTHIMSGRNIPDPQIIREIFIRLQSDPERRLVEEFFWFWPLELGKGKTDPALFHIRAGARDKAFDYWTEKCHVDGLIGLVAQHNLAILYHHYAIDHEFVLQSGNELTPEQLQRMTGYWKAAINYWEHLADNDDFWGIVIERVRSIDDPRLTTGFVRRMRRDFPFAFDRINAQLAVTYASKGRFTDARRHVAIMKETHQGLDDVEQTIASVVEPMEKKVGLLATHAMTAIQNDPTKGLQAAHELMKSSKESLEIAKSLLDDGHSIRTQLFDLVSAACFSCLIAYGNKTEDWLPCIKLLEDCAQMAVTEEFKRKVKENLEIAKANHQVKTLHETCWFCKRNKADNNSKRTVKMYGELYADYNNTCHWKNIEITIPRCQSCSQLWNGGGDFSGFTAISTLASKGWHVGDKPSEDDMRRACGLPSRAAETTMKVAGPIVGYAITVGFILLVGFIGSIMGCH